MLSLRIALRYLAAKKSHSAVNVISLISMAGVAVATAAIVVVLSVFNGFNDLAAAHLSAIDPELKAVPTSGKVFEHSDSAARAILGIEGVKTVVPVLEERGLLVGSHGQMPVRFKGVDTGDYIETVGINSTIIDGTPMLPEADGGDSANSPFGPTAYSLPQMHIAVGVAMETGLRPTPGTAVNLYVPRRKGRINPANPAASYVGEQFQVAGVFRVEQPEYDADYIFIPLHRARTLLDYHNAEASALEISLAPGSDAAYVSEAVGEMLGSGFQVQTRLQQQSDAFRMIAIEKWMTFLMLTAILLIATFNIISTISLLVLEKNGDAFTLKALGASSSLRKDIFVWEGALITLAGGGLGLLLGALLSLGQQHFGWVKLAGDAALLSTSVYPVRLALWPDLFIVAAAVIAIAFSSGMCSRIFTRKF